MQRGLRRAGPPLRLRSCRRSLEKLEESEQGRLGFAELQS